MATSHRKHRRTHQRSSSTPEKILSTALAVVASVGMVVVIGIRTVDANAVDEASPTAAMVSASAPAPATVPPSAAAPVASSSSATAPESRTRQELAAYAASLAAEKQRLDTYRAKLVQVAKRLHLKAAAQADSAPTR